MVIILSSTMYFFFFFFFPKLDFYFNPFFFQANIFQSTKDFFVFFLSVAVMFKELTRFQRLGDKRWGEIAQPIVTYSTRIAFTSALISGHW